MKKETFDRNAIKSPPAARMWLRSAATICSGTGGGEYTRSGGQKRGRKKKNLIARGTPYRVKDGTFREFCAAFAFEEGLRASAP